MESLTSENTTTDKLVWYRIEKAGTILSTLTQSNNKHITCCKALQNKQGDGSVLIKNPDDINIDDSQSLIKKEAEDNKRLKLTFHDTERGKLTDYKLQQANSSHLTSSHGSSLISGAVSKSDGETLFRSGFFRGNKKNALSSNLNAPVFLKLVVESNLLIALSGGDTTVSRDVVCLGEKGFIPVSWVVRVMWIVDTKNEPTSIMESNGGLWPDIQQFPSANDLAKPNPIMFGANPLYLQQALNMMIEQPWVKKLECKTEINFTTMIKKQDENVSNFKTP